MTDESIHDPLNFMRNLWGNMGFTLPGMVAPTFDTDELDKRIKDMKAVEGWLRMNLSMLQMTIQGLEMQRTTVSTVQTMGQMAAQAMNADAAPASAPLAEAALAEAALWPWQMMQQIREQMQQGAEAAAASAGKPAGESARQPAAGEKPARPAGRRGGKPPAP